jgi:ribosomal protein S18 acetylase RimI-like enzyme
MNIRPAVRADDDAIWAIMEPTLRAGETYALPRDWMRGQALTYWHAEGHDVFVAEADGRIFGTYYLQANQKGGGSHVANCGYMTAPDATGRGIAAAMCAHSLEHAKARGFRAMQFNIVVSTNTRAVALWQRMGFAIVGTVPGAFHHPAHGYVDTYVMFRTL